MREYDYKHDCEAFVQFDHDERENNVDIIHTHVVGPMGEEYTKFPFNPRGFGLEYTHLERIHVKDEPIMVVEAVYDDRFVATWKPYVPTFDICEDEAYGTLVWTREDGFVNTDEATQQDVEDSLQADWDEDELDVLQSAYERGGRDE